MGRRPLTTKGKRVMLEDLNGANVIVRTVTFIYTGTLETVTSDGFMKLTDAAWIAETDRWSTTLATGSLREVEPYPGTCYVALSSVVDVAPWAHKLPRTAK